MIKHKSEKSATASAAPTSPWIKPALLLLLVVQCVSLALLMRFTRMRPPERAHIASTCVLLCEMAKMLTVAVVLWWKGVSLWATIMQTSTFLLAVPAVCYTFQTNLLWIAVTLLDAPTYMVMGQAKILTTALFSVVLLGKELSHGQVLALVILQLGVILVNLDQAPIDDLSRSEGLSVAAVEYFTGIVAVVVACASSGFASVYFEKMLKQDKAPSLWHRNAQLGVWGLLSAAVAAYWQDGDLVAEVGLLHNYDGFVAAAVLVMALGGLLVAGVMKYADNILKSLAVSVSVVVANIASMFLFDSTLGWMYVTGTTMILVAVIFYSR